MMANNTIGEKELKTEWPVVTGLTSADKLKGRVMNLIAERKSLIPNRRLCLCIEV